MKTKLENKLLVDNASLDAVLLAGKPVRIQTLNLHHLYLATCNHEFRKALLAADFVTADGWPIQLLFWNQKPKRVTGSDLMVRIASGGLGQISVALIGASKRVGDKFEAICRHSGVQVVFREHGLASEWVIESLALEVGQMQPSIVLLAVTPPTGEIIADKLATIKLSSCLISVGGAVDMLVGEQRRAPLVIQKSQMEWLFRLLGNPARFARRYLFEGLPMFADLCVAALKTQLSPKNRAK